MHSTTAQIATHKIVRDYLANLKRLLQQADTASVAVMAPTELERTINALNAILADAPDTSGHCHRCTTRWAPRWAWWHRAWPCRAWQIAHQHLIAADPTHPTGPIHAVGGPR
ncbi:hypothetical protein ACFT2C_04525 [Promicromonospora sp. NPDC057138]|uniref:hypothetical protein n=1 Tax=Promicromonospora sp. NPDC057138 TaxID=3346031 RepID=UPI003642388A